VQQCLVKSAVTLGLDPSSQGFLHRKHHRNHAHNHNNNNHHHDSNSSTPVTPVKTEYNVPSPPTTPNNFNHNKVNRKTNINCRKFHYFINNYKSPFLSFNLYKMFNYDFTNG